MREEPDPDNQIHAQISLSELHASAYLVFQTFVSLPQCLTSQERSRHTRSFQVTKGLCWIDESTKECSSVFFIVFLLLDRKKELFKVLSACAALDRSVNYCQGMAFLAGVLLMVMPGAEEAFWTMVAMLKLKGLDEFYGPGMPGIVRECARFEQLLPMVNKKMDEHLKENGVAPVLYLVPWFMSMFTNLRDWTTVFRIWDMFMADGISALHRVALTLLSVISDQIFGKDINGFLNKLINPVLPNGLTTIAFMKRVNSVASDALFTKANHALRSDKDVRALTPQKSPMKRARDTSLASFKTGNPQETPEKRQKTGLGQKSSVANWLKRALTPSKSKQSTPRTPGSALAQKSDLANPQSNVQTPRHHLQNPIVSPSKCQETTSPNPTTPTDGNNPVTPPAISPTSQEAFRMFSTPSPIVSFRGKKYKMTPTSPVHPMMMELCTVSSLGDKLQDDVPSDSENSETESK